MAGPLNKGILGLSLLALLTACGKEGPKEPLSPRVYVQQVSTREFAPPIQLSGDIQARVETQLSFRVGGKIIERTVDVGDHIQANQVLARLDPKDLKIQVETAQASVNAQQAQVVQTRAVYLRALYALHSLVVKNHPTLPHTLWERAHFCASCQ